VRHVIPLKFFTESNEERNNLAPVKYKGKGKGKKLSTYIMKSKTSVQTNPIIMEQTTMPIIIISTKRNKPTQRSQ